MMTKGAMKDRSSRERRIVGFDGWASGVFKGCLTLTLMGFFQVLFYMCASYLSHRAWFPETCGHDEHRL